MNARSQTSARIEIGGADLLATGCGTAVASICAVGLFEIERLVGGIYSAVAVLCGGALSLLLARRYARLSGVLPSSAGLLAYLARSLGRRWALLLALPYLLLSLFLVGAEATLVGLLCGHLLGLPSWLGSLGFLIGTWALCRAGLRLSLGAQAVATWALLLGLSILSLALIVQAARSGNLERLLLLPPPSPARLLAAVGQALFLFMGFELITCQADLVTPKVMRRALQSSVLILSLFYVTVSLGLSCLDVPPLQLEGYVIPQLAVAKRGGSLVVGLVTALSLLSSYTSFNGGLLTLSRLTQALAAQGTLPRGLAELDPRTLLPRRALSALLLMCIAATALVRYGGLMLPAILAAACTAALAYAGAVWAREQSPFREAQRPAQHRYGGALLALLFIALSIGVIADSGRERWLLLAILGGAYAATLSLIYRAARSSRAYPNGGRRVA